MPFRIIRDNIAHVRADAIVNSSNPLPVVGGAIHHIGNVHKYAREEDRPAKTMVVITTDGLENASCRCNLAKVREMIERQKTKCGREFIFMGANMDAVHEAGKFGIGAQRGLAGRGVAQAH